MKKKKTNLCNQKKTKDRRIAKSFDDGLEFDSLDQEPQPPKILGRYGKQEWSRIMPSLYASGILCSCDISLFTAYCLEMEGYYESLEVIKRGKEFVKNHRDKLVPHPAVGVANMHLKSALRIAKEYGFTPIINPSYFNY